MSNGGKIDAKQLANLVARFKQASAATSADRTTKDQLLDELQDAVGLAGRMVTETDILRRAEKLLQGG